MAGTVVDSLVSAAGAAAEVGVDSIPTSGQKGGTLRVGIGSEVKDPMHFSGAQGAMDSNNFCVANAVYDPLFLSSSDGKSWLPHLALSAVPDSTKKQWTITLRRGVTFHNGDAFNADNVVANYNSAHANSTVGAAIDPLIAGCVKVSEYVVKYTTKMAWTTFPFQLAEQQIAFMAHGSDLDSAGGKPIGTGPFKMNNLNDDWDHQLAGGGTSTWHANPSYWKKDANGGSLPYVDILIFKVIVDPAARWQALQSNSIDLMVNNDGGTIKAVKQAVGGSTTARSGSNASYKWVSDEDGAREPSINSIILNTNMNKGFWVGGKPKGAVNPSTGNWNPNATPVVADQTIRQACAMAINQATYLSNVDGGIGQISNGLYRSTIKGKPATGLYKDPKWPKYSVANGKKLVDAWKKANPGVAAAFVIDIVQGNSAQQQAFTTIKGWLGAIGITVTSRPLTQNLLIDAKIAKQFDASTWSQFGGMVPDLNYVWFTSFKFGANQVNGYVNFAQQCDPLIQSGMLAGMAAIPGSAAQQKAWQGVNARMAITVPYLFLDTTVTMFAARANVRNFAYAGAATVSSDRASSRAYSPDGGSARWEHIYKA
jgi:ABC-type transport system substrate-binding protein